MLGYRILLVLSFFVAFTVKAGGKQSVRLGESLDQNKNIFSIDKTQCEKWSFDNLHLMGPDTHQKATGWCWAHSIAALLEEQLCLKGLKNNNYDHCGINVSRVDVGTLYGKLDLTNPDGCSDLEETLTLFLKRGEICIERYGKNPYDLGNIDLIDEVRSYYLNTQKSIKVNELSELSDQAPKINLALNFMNQDQVKWLAGEVEYSKKSEDWIWQIYKSSKNENNFITEVFLHYCTKFGRRSFLRDGLRLNYHDFFKYFKYVENLKPEAVFQSFKRAILSGHSIGLAVCAKPLVQEIGSWNLSEKGDPCSLHTLVLNGIRWEKKKERCEVHVKNSYGSGDRFLPSQWYSIESFLRYGLETFYFSVEP